MVLPFVRIIRLGLANNIIKMSSIKLHWLSLNMCSNKYCCMNDFFLKIIPVAFFWNYSIKSDRQFYQGTLTFQVKHPRFHQQTAVCTYYKWTDIHLSSKLKLWFILYSFLPTELENVLVSATFMHTTQHLPLHFRPNQIISQFLRFPKSDHGTRGKDFFCLIIHKDGSVC